jgi:hypothetical protein
LSMTTSSPTGLVEFHASTDVVVWDIPRRPVLTLEVEPVDRLAAEIPWLPRWRKHRWRVDPATVRQLRRWVALKPAGWFTVGEAAELARVERGGPGQQDRRTMTDTNVDHGLHPHALAVIDTYFNALTHLRPEVVGERFKARAVNDVCGTRGTRRATAYAAGGVERLVVHHVQ